MRSGIEDSNVLQARQDGMNSQQVFTDVACTLCGCVCDDLTLTVVNNRIESTKHACEKAASWFQNVETIVDRDRQSKDFCKVRGETSSLENALELGRTLLSETHHPLVYGLSSSSTKGQGLAVKLADQFGGVVDSSASAGHTPSVVAFQRVGESTSSLGEVKSRADVVVYWGSNPVESHPRHLERYTRCGTDAASRTGVSKSFLIVVDVVETETARQADLFVKIEPGSDFEVLWALRGLIQGIELQEESCGGVSRDELVALAEKMTSCKYGALFFGMGLTQGPLSHLNVEAVLQLATDLHRHTRWVVRRMRRFGDVAGADNVLSWQTGYPFGVSLSRGFPRYQPGEFSAQHVLENREVDLCVMVGAEGVQYLSQEAVDSLSEIPTIVLKHQQTELPFTPTIEIAVQMYGVQSAGTAYRMDDTPIPLRSILQSDLPTDVEILDELLASSTRE
ncbi:formylmethanofuran dehydrogenase subunit B [Thalassoglobus sp. JC818]|uniref:formylmethanofuran dehydrogenase subunit B n=1 Tax=Thalassoglobus sp. JC818 TaxID=3232136 RepID=UPI00345AE5EA